MAEVYLDDIKLDFEDTEGDSTLGDLVGGVEEQIKEMRRFIIEISTDEEVYTDWREPGLLARPLSGFTELRLKTASVDTVVLQGLDTVQEYIRVVGENITSSVDGIRLGRVGGEAALTAMFDGLIEILRTMDALARGGGLHNIETFKEDPASICQPLVSHLEELSGARASGDAVLTADILEYEIRPFLEELEERLFQGRA